MTVAPRQMPVLGRARIGRPVAGSRPPTGPGPFWPTPAPATGRPEPSLPASGMVLKSVPLVVPQAPSRPGHRAERSAGRSSPPLAHKAGTDATLPTLVELAVDLQSDTVPPRTCRPAPMPAPRFGQGVDARGLQGGRVSGIVDAVGTARSTNAGSAYDVSASDTIVLKQN